MIYLIAELIKLNFLNASFRIFPFTFTGIEILKIKLEWTRCIAENL